MRYIFELSHPAHFHLFRNLAVCLHDRGDKVLFAAKQKDVLLDLLTADPVFADKVFVKSDKEKSKGLFADLHWLAESDMKMLSLCSRFNPDMILTTTFSGIHAGKLLSIPRFFFTEDDYMRVHKLIHLVNPFASASFCPVSCPIGQFTNKVFQYHGYQELAYLNPDVFKPNPEAVSSLEKPYILLRLADLRAHHDIGRQGLSDDFVRSLIQRYPYTFYISAERALPPDLEPLRLPLHPTKVHTVLQNAELVVGDSATMIAEAAVLGTPAVYTGYFVGDRGYLNELENPYQLLWGIKDYNYTALLAKIDEIIAVPDFKKEAAIRRDNMLKERHDPTPFFLWFIDHYPESVKTMTQHPDYDLHFRA
jgi:predicted glycosyltransferase